MLPTVLLKLSLVLPRIDPVQSMKITHFPERLAEFYVCPVHITNVSQSVRVGPLSLVSFRCECPPYCDVTTKQCYWSERSLHVHMFAHSRTRNTVVVSENGATCAIAVLQARPYGICNTLLNVRCHVSREHRDTVQRMLKRVEKSADYMLSTQPTWSHDDLTRWRFFLSQHR